MASLFLGIVLLFTLTNIPDTQSSYYSGNDYHSYSYMGPVHGGFTVDDNLYTLHWHVSHGIIHFRASARGNGFIGFGLSPEGKMAGSDLFISGMMENGTAYARDSHGAGEMDAQNNYVLTYIMEAPMYTEAHFHRYLNTGDDKEDIMIMNQPQWVIWSVGPPMDKLEHHGPNNRGAIMINLLNPPMYHSYIQTEEFKKKMAMPPGGMGGMGGGDAPPPAAAVADQAAE